MCWLHAEVLQAGDNGGLAPTGLQESLSTCNPARQGYLNVSSEGNKHGKRVNAVECKGGYGNTSTLLFCQMSCRVDVTASFSLSPVFLIPWISQISGFLRFFTSPGKKNLPHCPVPSERGLLQQEGMQQLSV